MWTVSVEPTPVDARRARRAVRLALAEARASDVAGTATLLVGELLANGVLHARTPTAVSLTIEPRTVRVDRPGR